MPEINRRRALTAVAALAATAGVQTVATAAARTGDHHTADPAHSAHSAHSAHAGGRPRAAGSAAATPAPFDEVYKGRRIQGRSTTGGGHHDGGNHDGGNHGGGDHGGGHHGAGYAVFVDGVELHLMRNADGTWISVVSHYDPVATPRAAARAAVDELRGATLLPFPAN
ncbi:tyrosinase family oxidase copper chaperone [Streptomyces sp. NPDC002328]|uniref:apotyrosinase chaperone MelC1 n=1 Tax=Streptomyces sp. NPDC002328 TaxID=3364642 RepID=UPI0036966BA4